MEDIPRYPPYVKGLPAVSVDDLLASQRELIDQISETTRYTEAHFQEWYLPALRRYASFVHLLPASETHHHRGVGGLLRHGMEVALWSLDRITNFGGTLAMDKMGAERRKVIPCWEFACFLCGLSHDLGKVVTDMRVTNADGKEKWDPYQEDLLAWAKRHRYERYFVHFNAGPRHKAHEMATAMVLDRLVTNDVKSYLSNADPEILAKLLSAASGTILGRNILHDYVSLADQKSVERDLKANFGEPGISGEVGVPVERNLVDAMRRLAKNGTWKANMPGGRLWMIDGSMFISWRKGAEDIIRLMSVDNVPGIPRDPDTLADILIERDIAKPCVVNGQAQRYWRIMPDDLQKDGKPSTELRVLRLNNAEIVLVTPPPNAPGIILRPEDMAASEDSETENTPPVAAQTTVVPKEAPAPAKEEEKGREEKVKEPVAVAAPAAKPDLGKPADEPWLKESEKKPLPTPATAELILPEALGGEPPKKGKKEKEKKLKRSGSPEERKLATARLVPRDEEPEAAGEEPAAQPAPASPIAPAPPSVSNADPELLAHAQQFFGANYAGSVLSAIAEDLSLGISAWGKEAVKMPCGLVAIRYPESFAAQGCEPPSLIEKMDELDWIERDPQNFVKKIREIDGFTKRGGEVGKARAVVLPMTVSDPFLVISGAPVAVPEENMTRPAGNTPPEPPVVKTPKAEPRPEPKPAPVPVAEKPAVQKAAATPAPKKQEKPAAPPEPKRPDLPIDNVEALLVELSREGSSLSPVQIGGRFYARKEEVVRWLNMERELSKSRIFVVLGSKKLTELKQDGSVLIGPA